MDPSFDHGSDFAYAALFQQLQQMKCLLIYTHDQNKLLSIHSKHSECGITEAQAIWNTAESILRVFHSFELLYHAGSAHTRQKMKAQCTCVA